MQVDNLLHAEAKRSLFELQARVRQRQRSLTATSTNFSIRQLLNLYLDENTAIVEWETEFDDLVQKVRKRIREVAILVFEGRLIASLREYWSSEQVAVLSGPGLIPGQDEGDREGIHRSHQR